MVVTGVGVGAGAAAATTSALGGVGILLLLFDSVVVASFFANTASVTPVGSKSSAFKDEIFALLIYDFSSLT